MNKLVLTLTFGVLASSAFATSNLQTNAQNAQDALVKSEKAGTLGANAKKGAAAVQTEIGQQDVSKDAKKAVTMAKDGVITKQSGVDAVKKANANDLPDA